MTGESAAQRYKRIVAGLDDAAAAAQTRDQERATELAAQVAPNDAELQRVADRAGLTRAAVALRWEAAVESLWAERWFRLRPPPMPDRAARAERLDALDREVDEALEALLAAVRRGRLPFRRG